MKRIVRYFLKKYYSFSVIRKAALSEGKVTVNKRTKVTSNTYLGDNFNSNGLLIYGAGKVFIGSNFHCGFGCNILTENHNINGQAIPYDDTFVVRNITIKDNVWLGINVTILPGVTIGEGAVIQAGSVVVSDLPDLSISGGHPAKVFAYRDKEHYFLMKSKNKYH